MHSRSSGERDQSELDGQGGAAAVKPWEALMALLVAASPSQSEAFGARFAATRAGLRQGQWPGAVSQGPAVNTTMRQGPAVNTTMYQGPMDMFGVRRGMKMPSNWTNRWQLSREKMTSMPSPEHVFQSDGRWSPPVSGGRPGRIGRASKDDLNRIEARNKEVKDTLSAAKLEQPGEGPAGAVVTAMVAMLATLDAWFKKNPEGVLALPFGPERFPEGMSTVSPVTGKVVGLPLARPIRSVVAVSRAGSPKCCICINCKLVDRCKVYHWVETMHSQPHVTEEEALDFDPKDPQVQVFIRNELEAEEAAKGLHPALTTEYDVFECDAFTPDEGKWLRLMPDANFIPT